MVARTRPGILPLVPLRHRPLGIARWQRGIEHRCDIGISRCRRWPIFSAFPQKRNGLSRKDAFYAIVCCSAKTRRKGVF